MSCMYVWNCDSNGIIKSLSNHFLASYLICKEVNPFYVYFNLPNSKFFLSHIWKKSTKNVQHFSMDKIVYFQSIFDEIS